MLHRITGGLFLIGFGVNLFVGSSAVPPLLLGILAFAAGIGLLAGI